MPAHHGTKPPNMEESASPSPIPLFYVRSSKHDNLGDGATQYCCVPLRVRCCGLKQSQDLHSSFFEPFNARDIL
jgi:hypothetical protein